MLSVTGDRVSAVPSRNSDIINNSSNAIWSCEYCDRTFDTKIGLGVHKSSQHREELNSERLSQIGNRPSRGAGIRNSISSKVSWSDSEIKALAKLDFDLISENPGMSEAARNRELASKLPGRSADAIKGQRRGQRFKDCAERVRCEAHQLGSDENEPNHAVIDTTVRVDTGGVDSTRPSPQADLVDDGEVEVLYMDGNEANQTDQAEINVSITVAPLATPSQSDAPNGGNQTDGANVESISGNSNINQIKETRLNHIDDELLARLKTDALLYARHIRARVKKSFRVEQLLHILNMRRENPNVTTEIEKWLDKIFDKDEGTDANSTHPRRRPTPAGYGDGRGLRRNEKRKQWAYLQQLYEKQGVKGVSQHVLRNAGDSESASQSSNTPTPSEMLEFWTKVFGTDVENACNVETTTVVDSTANCLWGSIVQEDIKRTELALKKAMGPDKISVKAWKSVPRAVRALFYNVILYHGVVIDRLSKARTIFIPKVANPSKPGEYRPISITSVIQRQLHRIFVKRLNAVRKFDDKQVAFRMGIDGVSRNLETLRTILEDRNRELKRLHIVALDIKKAFDSVLHEAVIETMSELKCPTLFLNYLKRMYSSAKTCLELGNGESANIRIGQGVFQGDPLSPVIFNHVIDRAIKKLDDDYGYPCGHTRVTCTAFADDVMIVGETITGTQLNIDTLVCELEKFGLVMNPSKCQSLSIKQDSHSKVTVQATAGIFKVNNELIKAITPSTKWKYLGINLIGGKIDMHLPNIRPKLERVENALLKPQQKLEIITKVIVPGLLHQAVLGNSSKTELEEVDILVRKSIRKIMHLPHDVPNCYIHAPVKCGGMGVPELVIRIPILRFKRMKRFTESDALVATQFSRTNAYRHTKKEVDDFLRTHELTLGDPKVISTYYLACLDNHFATKGLTEAYHSSYTRAWCNVQSNDISGGDFIKYHLISSCSLPTLARRAWGRPGSDVLCRHGCGSTESIHHVLQECTLTHGGRVLRHDRVLDMIFNKIVREFEDKCSVEKEPRLGDNTGFCKPDLLLHGGDTAVVIDLHIVGKDNMSKARDEKIAKYRDRRGLTTLIKNRYKVKTVSYYAITISYCGIIERVSRDLLRKLNFTNKEVFRITTSVLRGSWLSWFCFKRMHQQPFLEARYRR